MSKTNKTTDPAATDNTKVASAATESNSMRLGEVALLGTFGSEQNPGALIRLPAGKVIKVAPGDQTTVGTVMGIKQSELILSRGGRTRRLVMPR